MIQLKGNLTHVDRAHATYWLKAHGFINPYWHVWEGNLPTLIFKRQERGLRGQLAGIDASTYWFHSVFMYMHM